MKNILRVFLAAAAVFMLPAAAFAGTGARDQVYLGPDEVFDGNFYAAGDSVVIEGRVHGDVIVAGAMVTISGSVSGDIIAAGGDIRILGPVQGDLRAAGGSIYVDSVIGKNVTIFGSDVYLDTESAIGASALIFAGSAQLYGDISENLLAKTGSMRVAGKINGDAEMTVFEPEKFFLQSQAVIGGDLTYKSPKRAEFLSGSRIIGQVNYHPMVRKKIDAGIAAGLLGIGYGMVLLYALFSLFLVGAVLLWLVPKQIDRAAKVLADDFWPSFGRGLILLFLAVIAALLLMMTIIGIPLALALLAIVFVAALCGIVYFSVFLGELILRKILRRKWRGVSKWWSLLLGVLLFVLIAGIPFVGWLLKLLMIAIGVGAWSSVMLNEVKRMR